jgi:chromate transporter
MDGLKPAVIGLIGSAVLSIGKTVFIPNGFSTQIFNSPTLYVSIVIFALCAVLAFKKVHPILIICLSALLGIGAGYLL